MPVPLRRFYAQKLIDAKTKEAEDIKKARQDNDPQTSRPTFQKS
tara:strand:- start:30 stop:161 length:132 start_codon:yes stop_codon:yes gene_type:complete